MITLLRDQPDFALGLYTICYNDIKGKDLDAVYGNLPTLAYHFEIMENANNISRKKLAHTLTIQGILLKVFKM